MVSRTDADPTVSGEPRIGFATLCRGRVEHLRKTLPANLAGNADYPNAVFVVLDYGDTDGLSEYIKTNHRRDLASGRLVYYALDNGDKFRLAHGKNVAMRCAIREGATLCCVLDADNFTGKGFARFIAEQFIDSETRPGTFLSPDYQLIKAMPHGALRPVRGYAGRMVCSSQTFIKLGGFDEIAFETWRGEDMDFVFRLLKMGYHVKHIPNEYLHGIGHNSAVRFREYPHAVQYENKNEVEIIRSRTETVCNFGKWGLGVAYRNFDQHAIELKPIPTRVFGIGMARTGTTSLDHAFKLLGLDSLHWGVGEAPLIWQEINALGWSPTLERFYALSDNPLPLIYEKLDRRYPGSLFILTIRDEIEWLLSVRRLWDPKYNENKRFWKIYPITDQIHHALYGTTDFDPLVFLERYRRHNQAVKDYFRNRPNDLLVMDMDKGGAWPELCRFLDCPIPNVPYPRVNRSKPLRHISTI